MEQLAAGEVVCNLVLSQIQPVEIRTYLLFVVEKSETRKLVLDRPYKPR